jgi:hypothetical protein
MGVTARIAIVWAAMVVMLVATGLLSQALAPHVSFDVRRSTDKTNRRRTNQNVGPLDDRPTGRER